MRRRAKGICRLHVWYEDARVGEVRCWYCGLTLADWKVVDEVTLADWQELYGGADSESEEA